MAAIVGALGAIGGGGLGLLGTGLSAVGSIFQGVQANAQAKAQAKAAEKKGDIEYALAQRKMIESKRQARLLTSRQQAVAAASGGGVGDPTVVSIMGNTMAKGQYNALIDMYNGGTIRDDLYQEAATTRAEGKAAMFGSFLNAGSTIFGRIGRTTAEYG